MEPKVTLADISPDAIQVARKNISRNQLNSRVSCVKADALALPPAYLGKFDLIVSNPPYITGAEMEELPHSVKDYEPHMALHGGDDGLDNEIITVDLTRVNSNVNQIVFFLNIYNHNFLLYNFRLDKTA